MIKKIKQWLGLGNRKLARNAKVNILVVEDNAVDSKIICRSLEKEGYRVTNAKDGEEGLRKVKEQMPDLVILDCEMPVMSGNELCRQLKENSATRKIPVLFLTGVNTPANILECYEMDAENYLTKPVNPKLVISYIEETLGFVDGKTV